jgi:Sap, sulfolipid-1-addressing protein
VLAAERISSVLEVLGATLPFAVGMLLSPFPIIAVLLVLLSPSGRAGGLAYSLGRFVGVALVATAASLLTEVLTLESDSSLPSAILRILLGVALLGLAVVKWRKRPETSEDAELPKWMSSVERRSPRGAAGLGFVLSVANPKELAFSVGAGADHRCRSPSAGADSRTRPWLHSDRVPLSYRADPGIRGKSASRDRTAPNRSDLASPKKQHHHHRGLCSHRRRAGRRRCRPVVSPSVHAERQQTLHTAPPRRLDTTSTVRAVRNQPSNDRPL